MQSGWRVERVRGLQGGGVKAGGEDGLEGGIRRNGFEMTEPERDSPFDMERLAL